MNHLAHIYLSLEDDALLVGNFMGDYVKNKELKALDGVLQLGVLLHRFIDTFSDSHPVFRQSTARLHTSQGKYAPVVVDLFYDHFLSVHWNEYYHESLEQTTERVYDILSGQIDKTPRRLQERLPRMISNRFLERYGSMEQLASSFSFLARRARFPSNIHLAHTDLQRLYGAFQNDFKTFFPHLITEVEEWKRVNLQSAVRS